VRRQGSVGHGGSHLELYFVAGPRKGWVRIDTRLEEMPHDVVIMNLVSNAALRAPKRFPLELTVERLDVQLKVDGDRLGFHVFKCRRDAVAVARVEDRWVYVNAPASLLRRLELRRERPAALRKFLERVDKEMAGHRAAVLALRESAPT
jgi:hypothetical protein